MRSDTVGMLVPSTSSGQDSERVEPVGTGSLEASEGASSDEEIKPSDPADTGEITHQQKRSYLRTFARIWMPIMLLLIIFVVVLMAVSRHLRLWVLGRWRPVKFEPVEDLWWKKDEENEK